MRRFISILLLGLLILCPLVSHAAGTVSVTSSRISVDGATKRVILTLTCTGDAANGTFPATTITSATYGIEGWYLYSVETNPGTTAPTALYDIAVNDTDGFDVAGGLLANRSASATEKVYLGSVGYPVVHGNLSWAITNNSVNSASIVAKLVFVSN